MEMTLDDVDGIAKGHFFLASPRSGPRDEAETGTPPGAPQQDHHTTAGIWSQQFDAEKQTFLRFTPFMRKLFVRNPVL